MTGNSSDWKSFIGTKDKPVSPVSSIVKRNGAVEQYNREKIAGAIERAIIAVKGKKNNKLSQILTASVETKLAGFMKTRHPHSAPAVEEIQDTVESVLVESGEVEIAKAYILYRAKHEAIRDAKKLMIDINTTMNGYLMQSDWRVNENSNVNFSLGGLILHNSGTITANYWLKNVYPEDIADAHINADFHIHDLSMFSGYCAGWSLRQLIEEGLGGVRDKIKSKPARHLMTLIQQIVNFLG